MTTLRVILDPLAADSVDGVSRYTVELTRQLIATAPAGCDVEGLVSFISDEDVALLNASLPGLAGVTKLPLARRELTLAWQSGLALGNARGMVHSPSLLAPLGKHDRLNDGDQVAVTIHDVAAWKRPESLDRGLARWQKSMAKRARKFADAVVVPTHAVADQLTELLDFGDRLRVIGGAPASTLRIPQDAEARAIALALPDQYAVTMGSIAPRKGVRELIQAMALPSVNGLPLVIVGTDRWGDESASGVAAAAGLPEGRVLPLGFLSDADLAVVLQRAAVFVYPSLGEGFGLPLVEAFQLGTPVIHSDDPALLEVGGGAGLIVPRDEAAGYSERLALAIESVLGDSELSARLRVQSMDRSRAFSWRDSAERVWQLHADL